MISRIPQEISQQLKFCFLVLGRIMTNLSPSRALIFEQISLVTMRSLSTVCFSGFFVGAILVIQFQLMLAKYDAMTFLGGLNTSATLREIGPLIISFLLAGKVGAFTTAELGTMRITEQMDAIRCLGVDPLTHLVVPRFIAIIVSSLFLLVFGLGVGILGSILVAKEFYHMNVLQYLGSIPKFTDIYTIIGSIYKCLFYSSIVATVSTYKGFYAEGGALGVGRAVTECSVYTNIFIVFANYFTSWSFRVFETAMKG